MNIAESEKDVYSLCMRKIFICLLFCFISFSVSAQVNFWSDIQDEELADLIINSMTDKELLGQVFMLGFGSGGYSWSDISSQMKTWIISNGIGSIKTFGWNGRNLTNLAAQIASMQSYSQSTRFKIPLFIATDQEGGWVRHVQSFMSKTPGNIAIGATGSMKDAYNTGYFIGMELKTLGINMNFAPTVDIFNNFKNSVIGPRSFSENPAEVAQLSLGFFLGQDAAGIISTAKHYPGHGDTSVDSHGSIKADIPIDFATMWARELVPYRLLVKEGLPAVMSGHLFFPNVNKENLSASMSPYFLKDLLRGEIGFEGLIITDDMKMGGHQNPRGAKFGATCMAALKAGNDIILISGYTKEQTLVWDFLYKKMKDKEFKKIVKDKVRRILLTKMKYLKRKDAVPLYPKRSEVQSNIPNPEGSDFFFDHAFRSITILKSKNIPFKPKKNQKILLAGEILVFLKTGSKLIPTADIYDFPWSKRKADPKEMEKLKKYGEVYDIIIMCTYSQGSSEMLSALKDANAKVYLISVLNPVYINDHPWIEDAIAVYGYGEESLTAGFLALLGEYEPGGILPLDLSRKSDADEEESGKKDN